MHTCSAFISFSTRLCSEVDKSIKPKYTSEFKTFLTYSFSSTEILISSFNNSIKLSSSNGDPSLTTRAFLIFFFFFFSVTLFDFLLVWEKLLLEDLPDVLLCWDSENEDAPDMDIWSASKPSPPWFMEGMCNAMVLLLCWTILSLRYLLEKSSKSLRNWFFLTS